VNPAARALSFSPCWRAFRVVRQAAHDRVPFALSGALWTCISRNGLRLTAAVGLLLLSYRRQQRDVMIEHITANRRPGMPRYEAKWSRVAVRGSDRS